MSRPKFVICGDCMGAGYLDQDGDPCDRDEDGADQCETCGGRGEVLEGAE